MKRGRFSRIILSPANSKKEEWCHARYVQTDGLFFRGQHNRFRNHALDRSFKWITGALDGKEIPGLVSVSASNDHSFMVSPTPDIQTHFFVYFGIGSAIHFAKLTNIVLAVPIIEFLA